MLDWVMAPGDARPLLHAAAPRALRDGALLVAALALAPGRVVTIGRVDGARHRRPAAWPDVLVDWSEVYDTRPYPVDATAVLAQELSVLGAPAFAVAFDAVRGAAAVAWYERGELLSLEHVGEATVAWSPSRGLGRPNVAGVGGAAASLARKLGADDDLLDRIETQHAASARAIVERALVRLCDRPPALDDLEGVVALASFHRLVV